MPDRELDSRFQRLWWDFYFIPGAFPQADIDAAPLALNTNFIARGYVPPSLRRYARMRLGFYLKRSQEHQSDAGQHKQSQKRQAKQQAGKNHKDDAHGLEMKALCNGRNQNHGGQENRDTYVLVSRLPGFCPLFGNRRSFFIQTKKLLVLRIVVRRHEDWARRRLRVVERIGPQPGCEGGSVLVAKATLQELRCPLLTIELGSEPTVEGVAVVLTIESRPARGVH